MTIKVKDKVVMKASVIKRTNYSDFSKNFKGVVVGVFGKTVDVQTDTGIRSVPAANLSVVQNIYDSRTRTTSHLVVD
jgi:hypothetical protein